MYLHVVQCLDGQRPQFPEGGEWVTINRVAGAAVAWFTSPRQPVTIWPPVIVEAEGREGKWGSKATPEAELVAKIRHAMLSIVWMRTRSVPCST